MTGVEHARRMRGRKAAVLGAVGGGRKLPADVIREPPACLLKTDLWELLLNCPQLGPQRARIICERARVFPNVQLGRMTEVERVLIIHHLPRRYK